MADPDHQSSEPAAGPTPNLPCWCRDRARSRARTVTAAHAALRALFGLEIEHHRADLKDVLEDGAGETGFSRLSVSCSRTSSAARAAGRGCDGAAPTSSPCSATSCSAT